MKWFRLVLFGAWANGVLACPAPTVTPLLEEVMADERLSDASIGGLVVDANTGLDVWSREPDTVRNPASTQKLLTLLAVLDKLGPAAKFTTQVEAVGVMTDGVLDGDLYLVGSGDPALEITRLWKLAIDTQVAGIQEIKGDIIVDESLLGKPVDIPGWDGDSDGNIGSAYEAPLSTLSVHYNVVGVVVSPGPEVGKPAHVRMEVPSQYVTIDNQTTTTQKGRRQIAVKRTQTKDGLVITVSGKVPEGAASKWIYRNTPRPGDYAAAQFKQFYEAAGGKHHGSLRTVTERTAPPEPASPEAPAIETRIIAANQSFSSAYLLGEMTKHSNNQMAEQMARLAALKANKKSSASAVRRLLSDTLKNHDISTEGAIIHNASGLSRDARMSPRQMVGVLDALTHHPVWQPEAMSAMAIYGMDGTLSSRLKGSEVQARVRAKTGSMDGVSTIAGVAQSVDGEQYLFSLMYNELPKGSRVKPTWDAFLTHLVEACPTPDPSTTPSSVQPENNAEP